MNAHLQQQVTDVVGQTHSTRDIAVLIPCYNEEVAIEPCPI